MPIYEYRCSNCGHKLEALQKISEPLLVSCPSCSEDKLVKLVSAAGFQLKGSGWYVTDFRGGAGAKKPAADDAPAKPGSEAASATDSKAEKTGPSSPAPDKASGSSSSSESASSSSPASSATPASAPSGGAAKPASN